MAGYAARAFHFKADLHALLTTRFCTAGEGHLVGTDDLDSFIAQFSQDAQEVAVPSHTADGARDQDEFSTKSEPTALAPGYHGVGQVRHTTRNIPLHINTTCIGMPTVVCHVHVCQSCAAQEHCIDSPGVDSIQDRCRREK